MEPTRITLVPHTHWDREWYQPFDEFLVRLVEMMDTLVALGDAGFPHFHLDGQTAMIDDYLAVRPERLADVQRLAREGRFSVGPWVTQMDEFLASGESHIRNLEMGLARAGELGSPLRVGYLPDQFGHIGQMPQILRQGGIDRAVVWRGVPAEIDRTAFVWESPDGSNVQCEYLAFGYFNGQAIGSMREPVQLAEHLRACADRLAPFLPADRMVVMVGSDHAGPDPNLAGLLAEAGDLLPGVSVEIAGLASYLEGEGSPPDLPVWRGELRSSARAHLLPNVYSARVHQKRERGRVEALVERYAEPLAALVPGFDWPAEGFDRAWTLLLWNGAHDSACGCSHDQVARDVDARFAEARGIAELVVDRALGALAAQVSGAGTLRFNPSPFEREGVPALGWRVDPGGSEAGLVVELPVSVGASGDGAIVADGIELRLFDEPDLGDLYTYCYAEEGQVPTGPSDVTIDGRSVIATFDERLQVRLTIGRRADERFLRLDGVIDNGRPDHRLRLHVTLPESAAGSLAGSPFELVERGLASEGSDLEAASSTWPARHVVVAGRTALLHEGVFEYEVSGPELIVTLLRCVGTISRVALATRPFEAGPDVPTPAAQMIGQTGFSLAVMPEARADDVLEHWERFAMPLLAAEAPGGGSLPQIGSLLDIAGHGVLSSVRRRDGVVQVRLWNPRTDRSIQATVGGRRVGLAPARIRTVSA